MCQNFEKKNTNDRKLNFEFFKFFFRTIEYMSPEVMNCSEASPASDVWGIGVITYQLLSGGISPFFAVNRFRTMSKVLECDFSLDQVGF